jgi:glycosidase
MPWTAAGAGHGFTTGAPWLAFGAAADETAVDVEDKDPTSMLTYYRQMLAFRRGHAVWGTGDVRLVALDVSAVVAFVREDADESYLVVVNLSDEDQDTVAAEPLPAASAPRLVFGEGTVDTSAGNVHVKLAATTAAVFQVR